MKLGQLAKMIEGWNSKFPPTLAVNLINEALDFIYNEYDWSFLFEETYLKVPKMITTGFVDVTKYSNSVDCSSSLETILDAIEGITEEVRIVDRQIIFLDGVNQNVIYNIVNYASGNIILDKPYFGETKNNIQFRIFKAFYNAPTIFKNGEEITDFKRFKFITDLTETRNLNLDKSIININELGEFIGINSFNNSFGTPYAFSPYKLDSSGNNLYLMYPIHSDGNNDRLYRILYLRKGIDLNHNDNLPNQISKATVMAAVKIKLYEWCEANKAKDIELQKTNWIQLIALLQSPNNRFGYLSNLDKDIRNDEDNFPKANLYSYYQYNDYFDGLSYLSYPPTTKLANF